MGYYKKKRVNYYPFGLKHKGYNTVTQPIGNGVAQKFKYNGIEYEESLGLDMYEMDLRMYDPAIARWNAIDIVDHYEYSPYQAFDNNPVFWSDPSGADSWQYTSNGIYRNRETGEETDDYQRAISETQSHFGETPPDNIYTNSKTGKVTIHRTNDGVDNEYVDGKYVKTSKKGTKESELIKNGTKYTSMDAPQGVGMGLTDGVLTAIASEFILAKAGIYALLGRATAGVSVAAKNMVYTTAEKLALRRLTGFSNTRIVNGRAIISQFGIFNKPNPSHVKLLMNALRNNGATSIKIYTNSANQVMKDILIPRMKSGRGIFGLSIKKRKLGGYIIQGKL
jgi:RHS repeat-associated protein